RFDRIGFVLCLDFRCTFANSPVSHPASDAETATGSRRGRTPIAVRMDLKFVYVGLPRPDSIRYMASLATPASAATLLIPSASATSLSAIRNISSESSRAAFKYSAITDMHH